MVNAILQVQDSAGSDCGQKINATLAYAEGSPVKLMAGPLCGIISTPVTLQANQHLILLPGLYPVSKPITLTDNATIECDPASDVPNTTHGTCILQQTNGANLNSVVTLTGANAGLSNVSIDANGSKNAKGVGLTVQSVRARLDHVSVSNSGGIGILLGCIVEASNCAAATKLDHVMSLGNGGDAFFCQNTSDVFVSNSEFENSGGSAIELNNCPGIRIEQSDLGGAGLTAGASALLVHGTSTGKSSSFGILLGSNVSGNQGSDVEIDGWDGSHSNYAALNWTIVGNQFGGSQIRSANTYASILIVGSGLNTISANQISSPDVPHQLKYPIEFRDIGAAYAGGYELSDIVSSNIISGTPGSLNDCVKMSPSQTTVQGLNVCFNNVGVSAIGPHNYYPNSQGPQYMDASGVLRTMSVLAGNDVEYMFGHPTAKLQIFQPNPGTDLLTLDGSASTVTVNGPLQATGVQLKTAVTACTAANRGLISYIAGNLGTKDTYQVCAKDERDVYAWRLVY